MLFTHDNEGDENIQFFYFILFHFVDFFSHSLCLYTIIASEKEAES